jgi:hypothetical protein
LLVSDSGNWLGRAADGWVVGRPEGAVTRVDDDARALMPLLDRDWGVARFELDELEARAPDLGPIPLDSTVALALRWRSQHWATAALRWFEDGYPIEGFREEVATLVHDKAMPQASRHLAARLLKTIK